MTAAERLAVAEDQLAGLSELSSFTSPNPGALAPGVYISRPQGHALLTDGNRCLGVLDLGGIVQIAGVAVTDWEVLARLGMHLMDLAGQKIPATNEATP